MPRASGAALAESPEHRQPGRGRQIERRRERSDPSATLSSSASMPFMRMALAQRAMESRSWRLWASSISPRWLSMMLKFSSRDRPSYSLQRKIIEPRAFRIEIVGAHDGRVAAGVAAADPAALEHGHVGDAVILCQVIRGGEAMPAAADDDDVVARLGRGVAPCGRPVPPARKARRAAAPAPNSSYSFAKVPESAAAASAPTSHPP